MKTTGNSILRALLAAVTVLFVPIAAAQITFYEQEGLRGRAFTADRPIHDFAQFGFNDRVSSVIVQRGQWEVCDDADFRGRCLRQTLAAVRSWRPPPGQQIIQTLSQGRRDKQF